MAAGFGGGLLHRDGFEELGRAVENAEQVFEAMALGQWAHHIDVEVLEALRRHRELPYTRFDVRGAGRLTSMTAGYEFFNFFFHPGPVIELADSSSSFFIFWVG